MTTKKTHTSPPRIRLTDDPHLKENPYKVPENYFENFQDTLDLQKDNIREVRIVPAVRQNVKRLAIAAVILLLISVSTVLFFTLDRPVNEQYSDQVSKLQDKPKKNQVNQPGDTTHKATGAPIAQQKNIPEVKIPVKPGVTTDNSIETLTNEGITDDDIIEYLMDEGFDVIDLSYQP